MASRVKRVGVTTMDDGDDESSEIDIVVPWNPPSVLKQPAPRKVIKTEPVGRPTTAAVVPLATPPPPKRKSSSYISCYPEDDAYDEEDVVVFRGPDLSTPSSKKAAPRSAEPDPFAAFAAPLSSSSSSSSAPAAVLSAPTIKQVEAAMGARDRRAITAKNDGAFQSAKHQASLDALAGTPLFLNAHPMSAVVEFFATDSLNGTGTIQLSSSNSSALPPPGSSGSPSVSAASAQIEPRYENLRGFETALEKFASGAFAVRVMRMEQRARQMHGEPGSEHRHPLTSEHVRDSLLAPHSGLNSCNSANCVGTYCAGNFALVEYLEPDQLEHFRRTGNFPIAGHRLGYCYLCMLRDCGASAKLHASGQRSLSFQLPFFYMVNTPGGYTPEAMDTSAYSGHCAGVTTPIRRLITPDYVLETRENVWTLNRTPGGSSGAEPTVEWVKRPVKGYSERAELIFQAAPCPSPVNANNALMAVAYSSLPACEDLIFAALVPKKKLVKRNLEDLFVIQQNSQTMRHWQVKLRDFFGGPALTPETVEVCSADATVQELIFSLAFASAAVSLARLVVMVDTAGDNFQMVANNMRLTLVSMESLRMEGKPEFQSIKEINKHLIFYLMCARYTEMARMLSFDPPPEEIGGDVARPSGHVISLMRNNGIRRRIEEYMHSMKPIMTYYANAISSRRSCDDASLFQTDPTTGLLYYIQLRPKPDAVYFEAVDIHQNKPVKYAVKTESPLAVINALVLSIEGVAALVSRKLQVRDA